ncbi:hypothetical protein [Salirhabdus salicampi]|uniref:hypothetical protein n=1 Tax=Salirhabdus salicampi TaxID=476102 RepID=UPI0020C5AE6F|nr:hypothetical protein [Salirhabdus salicampi]MCP8616005.1 hypothetical protein [Salirhabdus salicampi]
MTNGNFSNMSFPTVNNIHDEALIEHFKAGVDHKVLILTPSFPFIFIGTIVEIVEDYVVVDVETTFVSELENRHWHVHIHHIEAFYIEREDGPKIPELIDGL